MVDDRRKSIENMTEDEQKEFLRKTVEENRRKMNIPRRRPEFDALGRSISIAAEIAPNKVPGKKVRTKDQSVAESANKTKQDAIAKKDQYLEKMPTLFELLGFMAENKELSEYSYQADLYEAIPKFTWSPAKRDSGKYLPIQKREFEHRKGTYHMRLTPAKLEEGDDVKEFYPGTKEELVEMELTQMAYERGMPMMGLYGVKFSLYELRKRLQESGHTYSIIQIKQALYIMNGVNLEVRQNSGDGEVLLREPIFSAIGLRTWGDWKELGKNSECFVRFNTLHVEAIKNNTIRLFNAEKVAKMNDPLQRWLFKRMSREWRGAQNFTEITMRLTSLVRDSGSEHAVLTRQRENFNKALDLLIESNDVQRWTVDEELGGKRGTKLIDVLYHITPSVSFVRAMKRFNQLHTNTKPLELPEN